MVSLGNGGCVWCILLLVVIVVCRSGDSGC